MTPKTIDLIGIPVDAGAGRPGCRMGPDALRTAGLVEALSSLGHHVRDQGNLAPEATETETTGIPGHPNPALRHLSACAGWIGAIQTRAADLPRDGLPLFLGGDHLMAAGTLPAMVLRAGSRPQFVLWLDAHSDIHDLDSTASGHLHGTPIAYAAGLSHFAPHFPVPPATVDPRNICMVGLRSVDAPERARLMQAGIETADMRAIDEHGIKTHITRFLDRVAQAGGDLHVSFDVDFLDPGIAPAVGTTVPGGTSFREAHLVMELLCDSSLVTSLDLAELNPFLDERGRTATLLVDLVSSLFGKTVLDRATRAA